MTAFDYSGGYFNPVLATSLKLGCRGNTTVEHVIVYWVGASLGAVASVYLYQHPTVQKVLIGVDKEKEEWTNVLLKQVPQTNNKSTNLSMYQIISLNKTSSYIPDQIGLFNFFQI